MTTEHLIIALTITVVALAAWRWRRIGNRWNIKR